MSIPNPNPIEDIYVANTADEIPILTERHCFKNNPIHYKYHLDFSVIIDNGPKVDGAGFTVEDREQKI